MDKNLITIKELQMHINDNNWLLFDCRFDLSDVNKGQRSYTESHIPGAIYAHLDNNLSSPITSSSGRHPMPDNQVLIEWLSSCGVTNNSQVVVYDDSYGAMATRLWWLLKCLGHQAVVVLDGGWQAWIDQGLPVDDSVPELTDSAFSSDFNDECVVSMADVIDNLEPQNFQLIDVRANERFIGKMEPIDPVAGHIPGAINIPLTDNLDETGFFKSPSELQQLYSVVSQKWPVDKQVYMCGSGVTACHSVFALALAGFGFPKVYAGSWSEWIRDSARPVATGME